MLMEPKVPKHGVKRAGIKAYGTTAHVLNRGTFHTLPTMKMSNVQIIKGNDKKEINNENNCGVLRVQKKKKHRAFEEFDLLQSCTPKKKI